jgi:hypothetical protein
VVAPHARRLAAQVRVGAGPRADIVVLPGWLSLCVVL